MRSLRVSGSTTKSNKSMQNNDNYSWFDLWYEVIDRNL
jgi:hypothetical protein